MSERPIVVFDHIRKVVTVGARGNPAVDSALAALQAQGSTASCKR